LLIAELAFPPGDRLDHVVAAVLAGSVLSALLAAVALRRRARTRARVPGA
jgi:Na+/H+ antiporter NhaA